jgi:hypothetical protein
MITNLSLLERKENERSTKSKEMGRVFETNTLIPKRKKTLDGHFLLSFLFD